MQKVLFTKTKPTVLKSRAFVHHGIIHLHTEWSLKQQNVEQVVTSIERRIDSILKRGNSERTLRVVGFTLPK